MKPQPPPPDGLGGLTEETARQRATRPAVANLLRLLTLPQSIQELVRTGDLSEGHARVLTGIKGAAPVRCWLARPYPRADVRAGSPVPQAGARPRVAPSLPAPELRDFAERLQRATGVRAQITGDLKRGKLTLTYRSAQELESLYQALEQVLS